MDSRYLWTYLSLLDENKMTLRLSLCLLHCNLNALIMLSVWITRNCRKYLKRRKYQTTLPASWEIYAGQEATVRTGHGTADSFHIGEEHQGCILSPCLFNLYAEHIIWNARLIEAQTGIKIAGRNINNLRYADDKTTFVAESEEELKSLLMKVKEES